ncbi:MAG: 5'/3'-nucleotidase SurE [Syntrophaceae bacterium]|nr:5'/3'-nucleotidase SurE [Syntrophaceae bacterium]
MTRDNPLILLTNDDGIHAEGLKVLKEAVGRLGEARIVAPITEQSAVGHSITLYDPIKAHEVRKDGAFYGYGIGGTPADSVKLAIHCLLDRLPDLVISGINNGANLGINVLYSGTVSAATEAAILGAPSMAVSIAAKKDPPFEYAIPHILKIVGWLLKNRLPLGVALNVNIPALPPKEVKGFRRTRQGLSKFNETFDRRADPRGDHYYWLSGEALPEELDDEIDTVAVRKGFVSVTPLFYDLTAHNFSRDIESSLKNI